MGFDLHTHSCRSDGLLTPAALVARALEKKLPGIALTDHDTFAGLSEARAAAAGRGLVVFAGIELTTRDAYNIHILGYFLGKDPAGLAEVLAKLRRKRFQRIEEIVKRLGQHGLSLTLDEVLRPEQKEEGASAGRPHVAQAIVRKGYARDMDEAFAKYLRRGRPGFVPLEAFPPAEGVRLLREAGGAPSVAHPGNYPDDGFIEGLVPLGLAGIETYHPDNGDGTKVRRYAAMAEQWGLAATGGSDFHGHDDQKHAELGTYTTPDEEFTKLERICR